MSQGFGRWAAIAAVGTLWATPSFAWREMGHWAVCEIAYAHLTDGARKEVDALLQAGAKPSANGAATAKKELAPQCTWPDMVRKSNQWKQTYPWHFINVDDGQSYFDPATVNPEGDILRALILAEDKISDKSLAADERISYLRFLAHFAGDSHQPLHVGRKSDLGGNNVVVSWFGDATFTSNEILRQDVGAGACNGAGQYVDEPTGECVFKFTSQEKVNLHKVWDLLMPDTFLAKEKVPAVAGDSQYRHKAFAKFLDKGVTAAQRAQWETATYWDWAEESLAQRAIAYDVGDGKLADAYYKKNAPLMAKRVLQAGYRLAGALNRIMDPSFRVTMRDRFRALRADEDRERVVQLLARAGAGSGAHP